jgi:hypothetical protein
MTQLDHDLDPETFPELARGRTLERRELVQLAQRVVGHPETWQHHVRYAEDHRHFVSLHRDADVEVWLICWTPVSDTGWHDHDSSAGAVAVAEGAVVEHNLAVGRPEVMTVAEQGSAYSFGPDHIHRMTGRDAESATVHVYSPPLWRMGQYTISQNGVLRRLSVSYADELRPLEPA